ncbi:MAG: sialidase family protein [Pseudobdellovibrionaceae bacterium]
MTFKSGSLATLFVADNSSNDLLYCEDTGSGFGTNHKINEQSHHPPSLTFLGGVAFAAFIKNNSFGASEILTVKGTSPTTWLGNKPVEVLMPGSGSPSRISSNHAPALTVFENKLFLAFREDRTQNTFVTSSANGGTTWSPAVLVLSGGPNRFLPDVGPSLTTFGKKLVLTSVTNSGEIEMSFFDGRSWSKPVQINQLTKLTPSVVELEGQLWVAFVAAKNKHDLSDTGDILVSSSSGDPSNVGSWGTGNTKVGQQSDWGPSMVAHNAILKMLFIAKNSTHNILEITAPSGRWGGNSKIGQLSSRTPAFAVIK